VATRRNLAPNPACKVDATGWSAVSNTGTVLSDWGRSTSVDAALPRTTGFEGTTGGDVLTPRAAVTAGQSYYWAVSVHATGGALSANMLVNYYAALSGRGVHRQQRADGAAEPGRRGDGQVRGGPLHRPRRCGVRLFEAERPRRRLLRSPPTRLRTPPRSGRTSTGTRSGASWDSSVGLSTSTIRQLVESLALADGFDFVCDRGRAGGVRAGVVARSRGRSRRAGSSASRCGCGTGS
jgi:hypothetical protein